MPYTTPQALSAVLDLAISGKFYAATADGRRRMMLDAGIAPDDYQRVKRLALNAAKIESESTVALARRYRDHVVREQKETNEVGENLRRYLEDPTAQTERRDTRDVDLSHPAFYVLSEVVAGRDLPTVEQLTAAGFPPTIAAATRDAAELAGVASSAVVAHVDQLAKELAFKVASDNPWPPPTDSWSDLAGEVPSAEVDRYRHVDYDELVDEYTRHGR